MADGFSEKKIIDLLIIIEKPLLKQNNGMSLKIYDKILAIGFIFSNSFKKKISEPANAPIIKYIPIIIFCADDSELKNKEIEYVSRIVGIPYNTYSSQR